jgi:orotidine-5'-phosphate decarboxylase
MPEDNEMQVPEPEGPPVMSDKAQETIQRAGKAAAVVVVGGAAAFLLLSVTAQSTSGALRSQQVKWQQRQADAAEEVARQSDHAACDGPSAAAKEAQEGRHE